MTLYGRNPPIYRVIYEKIETQKRTSAPPLLRKITGSGSRWRTPLSILDFLCVNNGDIIKCIRDSSSISFEYSKNYCFYLDQITCRVTVITFLFRVMVV